MMKRAVLIVTVAAFGDLTETTDGVPPGSAVVPPVVPAGAAALTVLTTAGGGAGGGGGPPPPVLPVLPPPGDVTGPAAQAAPVAGLKSVKTLTPGLPFTEVARFSARRFTQSAASESVRATPASPRRFVRTMTKFAAGLVASTICPRVSNVPSAAASGWICTFPVEFARNRTGAPATGRPQMSWTVSTQNASYRPFGMHESDLSAAVVTVFVSAAVV